MSCGQLLNLYMRRSLLSIQMATVLSQLSWTTEDGQFVTQASKEKPRRPLKEITNSHARNRRSTILHLHMIHLQDESARGRSGLELGVSTTTLDESVKLRALKESS